jgi:hypothetical protein
MPLTTIIWLNDVTPPRISFGACSEMYSGDTNEAVPTEMPSRKRTPISHHAVGATAEPIAPTT